MRIGRGVWTKFGCLLAIFAFVDFGVAAPARTQEPVRRMIPWELKKGLLTGRFEVKRSLSYLSTGVPAAWEESGKENFVSGKASIFLGTYAPLEEIDGTPIDFSKQLWITTKIKKTDGSWVTINNNTGVGDLRFYSMWSAIADQAIYAASADTATTCANWVGVSCLDGQCLKGFTAVGTPTCVPCGSGSGSGVTPTGIPFDQTNWTGHRWSQNNDAGAWFPAVSAGVATYSSTDVAVGQTMSTATLSRDQTVSFEVNLSLSSGGANPDHGYFGFSTGYVGYSTAPLVAVEFFADGNAYLNSKSGNGPLRGVLLGSYTKSAWIPVTMKLTAGGDFIVTINGASSTNNVASTFSLTTFNVVITEWDTVDGFQVRNLSIL